MKNRIMLVMLLGLLLLMIGGLVYWQELPRLIAFSPQDGADDVIAGTTIRLTFSKGMQEDSVIEHLAFLPTSQGNYSWEGTTLIFTPEQLWDAGETVSVKLAPGSKSSGWLSLSMRQEVVWSFTVRLPRLAFLYPANGPANVYSWNPVTGEVTQLTSSQPGVLEFDVNSTGTVLYYSIRTSQGSIIYSQVLLHSDSDSALPEPVQILSCLQAQCLVPSISPQGDILAYERTEWVDGVHPDYPQVWWLSISDTDGSAQPSAPVTSFLAGDPLHQTIQPDWSPAGWLSFYDTNLSAYIIMQPLGDESILFPNQTGQLGAWHPNGRDFAAPEILFLDEEISQEIAGLGAYANSHLILFNRLTGATRDLTPDENMEDASPAFSPDGEYMAFARRYLDLSRWTPGRQIWLMSLRSGETRPLTDDPFYHHYEITWSPGGDQLAYVRFNQAVPTEMPEVWVLDLITGQAIRILQGGYAPEWIP